MSKASQGFSNRQTIIAYEVNKQAKWQRSLKEGRIEATRAELVSVRDTALFFIGGLTRLALKDFNFVNLGSYPDNKIMVFEEHQFRNVLESAYAFNVQNISNAYYSDAEEFYRMKVKPVAKLLAIKTRPLFVFHNYTDSDATSQNFIPMPLPGMVGNRTIKSWQTFAIGFKTANHKMMFKLAWEDGT